MTITKLKNTLRIPALHLEADKEKCRECRNCVAACPMSQPVTAMVQSGSIKADECILCGTCADTCANKVIRFAWRRLRKT